MFVEKALGSSTFLAKPSITLALYLLILDKHPSLLAYNVIDDKKIYNILPWRFSEAAFRAVTKEFFFFLSHCHKFKITRKTTSNDIRKTS